MNISLLLASFALALAARGETSPQAVKAAIDKGLRRIEQGAASYPKHRECFSCHHQAMSVLSMTAARQRGFMIEPARIREQIDFTLNTFRPKTEQILKGQGVPGGNTMAVYALITLEAAGHPADETTAALVEYLLARQRPDGSWPAVTNRPPTEGSTFTNNALALRSLRAYGPVKDTKGKEELRARIENAFTKGKEWLRQNKPKTTEDKVFHLRGLIYAAAEKGEIAAARDVLLQEQREDGSWAQLADLPGDAYATGSVLMALRCTELKPTDPVYQKAVKYLLATQKADGAWILETRSRPVQTFFDNGDPGGKSQFISFVATNWAVLALLELQPAHEQTTGLFVASPLIGQFSADENWPQFRGKQAMGVTEQKGLPETWSTTKNVVWKTNIPGRGWSSPIVWGDKIFVTSVLREGNPETPAKGLYFGGNRMKPPAEAHRWMVYCVDWSTGKVLWEKQAHKGVPESPHHVKNTYASETPVTDGERVYAYFGNVGLFCYDMDGNALWSQSFGSFPTLFGWGTAASPVLHKDRVYIVNDNEKQSFLVALDTKTGKEVWRVDRDEKSNWATPFVWENEQRTEIVTCGKKKVRSYDLDGKPLWELGGMSSIVIPTPFAKSGLLYVSSGYVLDGVRPVFAIRPGASGDISLKDGQTSNDFVAWHQKQAGPYNPSPILHGDYLYVLYDRGFFSCYDARTGKEVYAKERIDPKATAFTSSPWAYDGKIFCLSEDGDTFIIRAGTKFELLGKNSLDEMCMATPAIARRSLIIRTLSTLYRIQEGVAASEE